MIEFLPVASLSILIGICVSLLLYPLVVRHLPSKQIKHDLFTQIIGERLTWIQKLQLRINRTNSGVTPIHYVLISLTCGLVVYVAGGLILRSWLLALPGVMIGILFTERVLSMLGARRRERFEEGNIRALRIMASSLRTSPSYLHAIEQVANSPFLSDRVSGEYKRLADLIRGQIPLETAMKQMHLRTGADDIAYLATIVQVQRELGGDMAKTLDLAASFILRRRQLQRRQRSTMSQILAQVNLLSVMPFVFAFTLYMNNPKHFDPLLATMGGRMMLLGAFLLIVAGGELIRYMALAPARKSR